MWGHMCYSPCAKVIKLRVNGSPHHVNPNDKTQVINLGGMPIKLCLFIIGQCSIIRQSKAPFIYLPTEGNWVISSSGLL